MQRKHAANLVNCAYIGFLTAGMVLPWLKSNKRDKERGLRTLEAIGGSVLLGQAVKRVIPELRPDGRDKTSFPSGHTAYAFTVASIASAFNRKQAPFWFLGALLIAIARVGLRRHHWWDALGGALLGVGMAQGQLCCREGWLVPALKKLNRGS
jgi:membrane-associated phospholipid phosphatase